MINLVNNSSIDRVYANIGDTVMCINDGGSYTTYDDFFIENNCSDLLLRYHHDTLTEGHKYKVIDVYPHSDYTCNVYILEDENNDIYLCTDSSDYLSVVTRKRA